MAKRPANLQRWRIDFAGRGCEMGTVEEMLRYDSQTLVSRVPYHNGMGEAVPGRVSSITVESNVRHAEPTMGRWASFAVRAKATRL